MVGGNDLANKWNIYQIIEQYQSLTDLTLDKFHPQENFLALPTPRAAQHPTHERNMKLFNSELLHLASTRELSASVLI